MKVGKQFKIPVARDTRLWLKDWAENQARPGRGWAGTGAGPGLGWGGAGVGAGHGG